MTAAERLGINTIGAGFDGNFVKGVIYRTRASLHPVIKFPHVVVSDRFDSNLSIDLVTLSNFRRAKSLLKKSIRKGLGVEFLISGARKMNGDTVAKWLTDLRDAYAFCESAGCQFIISSGAGSPSEMVSGICLDAILIEVGIECKQYWQDLDLWLHGVLSQKVSVK